MPMLEASKCSDVFIAVTGNKDVIRQEHFEVMKEGAILCNAGHFDVEVNIKELASIAKRQREVRANIDEYGLNDGRKIYVLAKGRLVNLAAGDGHPAEVMVMTFALQALSLVHLATQKDKLENRVYPVSQEIDWRVANLRLKSLQLEMDSLSKDQEKYLASWQ
jgi:adenosylhomocysteinase